MGDGAPGVLVRSNGTFPALLRHIRDWVELTGTEPLTVYVDGRPHTLEGERRPRVGGVPRRARPYRATSTSRGRSALTTYSPASTISEILRSTHRLASTYASSAESPVVPETWSIIARTASCAAT